MQKEIVHAVLPQACAGPDTHIYIYCTHILLRYLKILCFKRQQLLCTVSVFAALNTFKVLHATCSSSRPPPPPVQKRNYEIWGSLWKGDVTFNKAVRGGHIAPNKSRKRGEREEHHSPWIRLQDCHYLINFSSKFDIIWTRRFTVVVGKDQSLF